MKILDSIKAIFQKKKIEKFRSTIPTSMLPLEEISTVNVVLDVLEPGFDYLREDILAWGRQVGVKVNIYFFDFREIGKDELLLTSIQTTILKKELDWLGTPDLSKVMGIIGEKSDLFISMIENGDYPIDFLCKCSKARFKVGRIAYPGNVFDLVVTGSQTADLRSDSRRIFASIKEYIRIIQR